ncbi:hypothetical protein [Beduini massiliensis]|uniref:hypothetical protein n=1 Tax=Beduini massiliensis TaxID=1585974 RepID=UPI00059AB24F|nr:hypothetical protein [Beduini massiliensis]
MSDKVVTIDQFRKMNEDEQRENYQYMSQHDKYIWRVTGPISIPQQVDKSKLTKAQKENITRIRKRLVAEGKLSQEDFERFENE